MLPTTLSGYIALARDAFIVVAVGVILYLVYRGGEDHVSSKDLKDLQAQVAAQAKITSQWKDQSNAATQQLRGDLTAIAAASSAPVVHQWLPVSPSPQGCVLPAPAGQAASSGPTGGPAVVRPGSAPAPGGSGQLKDAAVAAFKQRWETVLAECRAEDAAWPH